MTKRQRELLKFIKDYVEYKNTAPTYSQMKEHMGVTSNQTITDWLSSLERDGVLLKTPQGFKVRYNFGTIRPDIPAEPAASESYSRVPSTQFDQTPSSPGGTFSSLGKNISTTARRSEVQVPTTTNIYKLSYNTNTVTKKKGGEFTTTKSSYFPEII